MPSFTYVDNVTLGFSGAAPVAFTFELGDAATSSHRPTMTWTQPLSIPSEVPLSAGQLNSGSRGRTAIRRRHR